MASATGGLDVDVRVDSNKDGVFSNTDPKYRGDYAVHQPCDQDCPAAYTHPVPVCIEILDAKETEEYVARAVVDGKVTFFTQVECPDGFRLVPTDSPGIGIDPVGG